MKGRVLLVSVFIGALQAQVPSSEGGAASAPGPQEQAVPLYRVNVVARTTKAVNYRHRSGPTPIDFRGTVLLADARGEAKVQSRKGATEIKAKFRKLAPPARFGTEYLTYVLWALTPEGRATNLGQIMTDGKNRGKLQTATELQAFALIVTAEPYFAVTSPSDVVVMENIVRPDTLGNVEEVEAKYHLLKRGEYVYYVEPGGSPSAAAGGPKISLDQYDALLEIYQAQNAVQIASSMGGHRYAEDSLRKAEALLQEAKDHYSQKADSRTVVMAARQATQTAEDARLIALRVQEDSQAQAATSQ